MMLISRLQNVSKKYSAYQSYVENTQNIELDKFYQQKKSPAILGSEEFIKAVKNNKTNNDDREISGYKTLNLVQKELVKKKVANYFNVSPETILTAQRGAGQKNIPRRVAMYLCRCYTDLRLIEIAEYFNVSHYSTVSQTISRLIKEKAMHPKLQKAIIVLSQDLTP